MNLKELKLAFISHAELWGHLHFNVGSVKSNYNELLFYNSGMAPLKHMFKNEVLFSPLWSIQKCVRLGGKHNDYLNIGISKSHLSFFEMMGVFSFGNYNIYYAISFIYDFLLRLGFKSKDLLITINNMDYEIFQAWKVIAGEDCNLVITYGEHNIWKIGASGLCGSCTEIYYIHGFDYWEILNIVFIKYDKYKSKILKLVNPGIDVGIGLERLLSALNCNFDVYQIENINCIAKAVWANANVTHVQRIIIDHIRSACLIISDNIVPSNSNAGYVLRKIIRRSLTEFKLNDYKLNLFYVLINSVIKSLLFVDSTIMQKHDMILKIMKAEIILYINNFKSNVLSLFKISSIDKCFNTFGISKQLFEKWEYINKIKLPRMSLVYNLNVLKVKIIAKSSHVVILNKTNLEAPDMGRIGDEGIIVGVNFSLVVRRQPFNYGNNNHLILRNVKFNNHKSESLTYILRNTCVFTRTAYMCTYLHAAISLCKNTVDNIKLIHSKVNYLGFDAQLNSDGFEPNLIYYLNEILSSGFCELSSSAVYIKVKNNVKKLIKINIPSLNLQFTEQCCGSHIDHLNLGLVCINVSIVNSNGIGLSCQWSSLNKGNSKNNVLLNYKANKFINVMDDIIEFSINGLTIVYMLNKLDFNSKFESILTIHVCYKTNMLWFSQRSLNNIFRLKFNNNINLKCKSCFEVTCVLLFIQTLFLINKHM